MEPRRHNLTTTLGALALAACSSSTPGPAPAPGPAPELAPEPAPAGPLEPEALETGMDCVNARAECGGGVCVATIKNACDTPVTCELHVVSTCRSGPMAMEVRGSSHGTITAGAEDELGARAACTEHDANLVLTMADRMSCK